jgi:Na+/citrate or Na+/malate symporter
MALDLERAAKCMLVGAFLGAWTGSRALLRSTTLFGFPGDIVLVGVVGGAAAGFLVGLILGTGIFGDA